MTSLFSTTNYSKIKNKIESAFERFRQQLSSEFPEWSEEDALLSNLEEFLSSKEMKEFSPLKLHWLKILDDLLFLYDVHEAYEEARDEKLVAEVKDIENEIFEFWNNSEFTQQYKEFLDSGNFKASVKLLPLIEQQAYTFFHLHISKKDFSFDEPLIYTAVPEIGDNPTSLYIGFPSQRVLLPENSNEDLFPCIAIRGRSSGNLILGNKDECSIEIFPNSFNQSGIDLKLTAMEESVDRERIKNALAILKELSPDCFAALQNFTHTLIPVNEPGIVSYSVQSLPGFSCVNLFERDFVDLVDDLIHENGHHLMNHLLTEKELIVEDAEKIFHSPWRNAPRPIRGIYHGTLTFFWALKLFKDLSEYLLENPNQQHFSKEQSEKIHFRALEEWEMIKYCQEDLNWAHQQKKVTDAGKEVAEQFYQELEAFTPVLKKLEAHLTPDYLDKINQLKTRLAEKRSEFNSTRI
ncbi:MAG: hypothetical protein HN509_13605 [Halobacteriovoraceae bacterium]|jgi:hypothetical protein|nr:hypothetical protein [Halobacteriovoraceae bacterium]MBT5095464.1 hypothetical protein [Halobacteriovoraceae bacterium]